MGRKKKGFVSANTTSLHSRKNSAGVLQCPWGLAPSRDLHPMSSPGYKPIPLTWHPLHRHHKVFSKL